MRRADLTARKGARRFARARGTQRIVLLSGFHAFGGARVNTSDALVRRLDGVRDSRFRIVGAILPCAFVDAAFALRAVLRCLRPAIVIALGEAERDAVTPERLAANLDDARIPDNRGRQPRGTPVIAGATASYPAQLPAERMVRALRRRGISARPSDSAGRYVCNHVFFSLMHDLARRGALHRVSGGFIHLPALRGSARLRLPSMAEALLHAIRTNPLRRAHLS